MKNRLAHKLIIALLAVMSLAGAAAEDFLDVDQAFRLEAVPAAEGGVGLRFDIAPGYHLYRDRISVDPTSAGLKLQPLDLPPGRTEHDDNLGGDVAVYRGRITLPVKFAAAGAQTGALRVSYQGCADAGLCYAPQVREVSLHAGQATPAIAATEAVADAAPSAAGNSIQSALQSGHLLTIASVFFVAGLLLSFTPCVLPMVPILSSIIVGQGAGVSRRRGFVLALAYSLGMELVYTAFGVAAGLMGEGLAAWLQNPWVLGAFGLLMVALALSMFGVYELQLPSALQTRLTVASGRLKGGNLAGVFAMGGLSALIVGPCVAAPLAGALVYISQTRNVLIGALALFQLAAGMSVPLLLVGLSAGVLLPRAGAWMMSVKTFFGVVLLAVAWWMVLPVLPPALAMLLLAALLALGATLLGAFTTLERNASIGHVAAKAAGWVLACVAVAQIAGAMAGAVSPWQPLQPLTVHGGTEASASPSSIRFAAVNSPEALEQALGQAAGRPVILDFYADWCVSCKEMEHSTFADNRVRQRLANALLLRADVTANTGPQRALLKRFELFGPPGVLFFDPRGQERRDARVVGYEDTAAFLKHLDALGGL